MLHVGVVFVPAAGFTAVSGSRHALHASRNRIVTNSRVVCVSEDTGTNASFHARTCNMSYVLLPRTRYSRAHLLVRSDPINLEHSILFVVEGKGTHVITPLPLTSPFSSLSLSQPITQQHMRLHKTVLISKLVMTLSLFRTL